MRKHTREALNILLAKQTTICFSQPGKHVMNACNINYNGGGIRAIDIPNFTMTPSYMCDQCIRVWQLIMRNKRDERCHIFEGNAKQTSD